MLTIVTSPTMAGRSCRGTNTTVCIEPHCLLLYIHLAYLKPTSTMQPLVWVTDEKCIT